MYRDGTMRKSLEKEMVEAGVPFAESLERRAKAAFAEQNQFTPFCKPIFDWDATIEEAKNKMPKHWAGLCTSSSDRSLAETGDESKDSFKLLTLVGTIRHRNKHLLSFFASIPAMANEAKGESNNASAFERHMRVQVGSTYVAEFFNSEFDGAVARQKELFSKQPVLEMVYDNYQKYLKLKSQRGAHSALPQEGTARYSILPRVEPWPIETILNCPDGDDVFKSGVYKVKALTLASDQASKTPTGTILDDLA